MLPYLLKSHVKAHTRRNQSGKVSLVREHTDSRTRKVEPPKAPAMTAGMEVAFKPEGGKKTRRGTVIGLTKNTVKIRGQRDNTGQQQEFTIDRSGVQPWSEFTAPKEKDARYQAGDKINATRTLAAKESLRRQKSGMKRLGMAESEVMNHRMIKGFIIKASATLAKKNGIKALVSDDPGASLWHRAADPEYADVIHEYAIGALQSLRRETASAPAAELKEFKEHLAGKRKFSNLFSNMMKHGETAAIRHLNATKEKTRDLIDVQSAEEDPELRRKLDGLRTEADQEHTLGETMEAGIERYLSKLPDLDGEIIRLKFGLGDYDAHTNEDLAKEFNERGLQYQGKYKWTRNHAGEAFAAAIDKFKRLGGIEELRGFLKSLRDAVELRKALAADFPGAEIVAVRQGLAVVCPDELRKSFSSDLAKKYAGGRWITIKEGPLAGRHIFILPHKDGTASVLAGGGPAMRHKILGLKRDEKTENQEKTEAPAEKPPKKPEVTEEKREEVNTARKEIKAGIAEERRAMAELVRQHLGKEVEITAEEKASIEKKVADIADPKQKAAEKLKETTRLKKEKDELLQAVTNEAKKAILEEEPTGQGAASIHAVVKEHAEDLLNHYYKIQALERQNRDLGKLLKVGNDRRPAADIVAFTPLTRKDLEGIVADEKARDAELEAHYKLIATTRGYVDAQGKDHKAKGGIETERNIRQGGFEAITGIVGEATGSSILTRDAYDELGPQNAAVLAHYFLKGGGHDVKGIAKQVSAYIGEKGGPVAQLAIERGGRFMDMARKAAEFGRGEDNLMSAAQALGTALKYHNKAFEAFGQAEGALNQGAELAYEFSNDKGKLEFSAGNRDTLERKRKKLRLNKGDVTIAKDGDGYKMTVPSRAFEKLIGEKPATSHGGLTGDKYSAEEIKAGKANTDDFRPSMLREYTPEDANGESRRIVLKPEQQSAARMIAQQKRVYLNFEAGTGKSLAIIAAKAHLEDSTGKPKKMIIAMPQKLMANFKDEVEKFSGYKVVIVDDSDRKKRAAKYASDPDTIVVVNKEKFNFDKALIKEAKFDMVAADEAHKITQREGRGGSDMSKGLSDVAKGAEYYVAMSGTPTPDDMSQLYFHANIIDPERFKSQKEFMARFGSAHKGVGYKETIQNFMNRELSDHVFTAKKSLDTTFTLKRHAAGLSADQRDAYRQVQEQFKAKQISPLQRDQQLNTVLNSFDHRRNGKFQEIRKIVDQHLATKAPDEKVIFYAKNYDTVGQIQDFLKTHYGHAGEAVTFTGREKVKDIRANKERFKHDPAVKFAIHTRAGVEGLNLQYDGNGGGATTAVAVASGEDSYAPLDQFFSRANRTGAKKDIHAHLVLTDSPHDMGTELRLDEKKGVGELIKSDKSGKWSKLFLIKSHVKQHTRTSKSGKVSVVREHDDKRIGLLPTYEMHTTDHEGKKKRIQSNVGHTELNVEMGHQLKKHNNLSVTRNDGKTVHYRRATDEAGNDYWDKIGTNKGELAKSHVKQHTRRNKSGTVSVVLEFERHMAHRGPATAAHVKEVSGLIERLQGEGHGRLGANAKKMIYSKELGRATTVTRSDKELGSAQEKLTMANRLRDHWYAALHPEEFAPEDMKEAVAQGMPTTGGEKAGLGGKKAPPREDMVNELHDAMERLDRKGRGGLGIQSNSPHFSSKEKHLASLKNMRKFRQHEHWGKAAAKEMDDLLDRHIAHLEGAKG